MTKKRHRYVLLLVSLIFVFVTGCGQTSSNSTWRPVWEVPPKALEYAQNGCELKRAMPDRYSGTIPRAFQDDSGRYRICLIKKDPHRDSYWYDLYEFTADGSPKSSAMSSIPSPLKEPDPTKIPGW